MNMTLYTIVLYSVLNAKKLYINYIIILTFTTLLPYQHIKLITFICSLICRNINIVTTTL